MLLLIYLIGVVIVLILCVLITVFFAFIAHMYIEDTMLPINPFTILITIILCSLSWITIFGVIIYLFYQGIKEFVIEYKLKRKKL